MPLSQLGALRCPPLPLAAWRLALSRISPPGGTLATVLDARVCQRSSVRYCITSYASAITQSPKPITYFRFEIIMCF
eukprot:6214164-Pleurochrysis_carterae.AAC.2